jgi:hypothetical protein
MQNQPKKYRAVSNVDAQGFAPALNRRANGGMADVRYFASIEAARDFLRLAGGTIYDNASDAVVEAIPPLGDKLKGAA